MRGLDSAMDAYGAFCVGCVFLAAVLALVTW